MLAMERQQTLALIKPEAVRRSLTGLVLDRYLRKGLVVVDMKMFTMTDALAEEFYREHRGKSFFGELVDVMTAGPLVAIVLEGVQAVEVVRRPTATLTQLRPYEMMS